MGTQNLDFILKLGGSAVTDKSTFETANFEAIRHAGRVLFKAWTLGLKFILVHGAGSYGHFNAKKYEVKQGFQHMSDEKLNYVKKGFCLTRISMSKLNQIITEELCKVGLPVVGIAPVCSWITDNGNVCSSSVDNINYLIQSGFIPLLHGDAVMDKSLGCTILSGDTIIKVLCEKLNPEKVIFVSDVNGIYDKPPNEPDAKLLKSINVSENGDIQTSVEMENTAVDVTGGIKFKLQTSVDIVRNSKGHIPVQICGIHSEAFEKLYTPETAEMTKISLTQSFSQIMP